MSESVSAVWMWHFQQDNHKIFHSAVKVTRLIPSAAVSVAHAAAAVTFILFLFPVWPSPSLLPSGASLSHHLQLRIHCHLCGRDDCQGNSSPEHLTFTSADLYTSHHWYSYRFLYITKYCQTGKPSLWTDKNTNLWVNNNSKHPRIDPSNHQNTLSTML